MSVSRSAPTPASRSRRVRRGLLRSLAGLALLAASVAACSSSAPPMAAVSGGLAGGSGFRGAQPATAFAKPELTLTDTAGHAYDIRTSTAGKVTLLYFGYTHCPDVCPAQMADIAAALRPLPAAARQQVRVVFVTSDPERDTPHVLRRWLDRFDPAFVGLTGSLAAITRGATQSGVPLEAPEKQPDGSYAVAHGAQVIGYGKDGRARVLWLAGTSVADFRADIGRLTAGA